MAQFWLHPPVEALDRKVSAALTIVQKSLGSIRPTNNLTKTARVSLKSLTIKSKNGLHFSVSDKGGEFVVTTTDIYKKVAKIHLEDKSVYAVIAKADYLKSLRSLKRDIDYVFESWDQKIAKRLVDNHPSINTFYSLFKTHKFSERGVSASPDVIKIRPIISGSGGPTDRPSWVVVTIIGQLLKHVGCHLQNTAELLGEINNTHFNNSTVYESFDVEALYTNIDNKAAYEAVVAKLKKHATEIQWYGVSYSHLTMLLKSCLDFNGFQFDGTLYEQKRGLAMGSRLAPVLAVLYMDIIETPSKAYPTTIFRRYIDDYVVIAESQDTLDNIFTCLNNQATHIRLTREKPKEGWLPFLNCELRIKNMVVSSRWYRKPSNKNLLVRMDSSHPTQQKVNTIRTTQKTATGNSTTDQLKYSKDLAKKVLITNGYPPNGVLPKNNKQCRQHDSNKDRSNHPILPIPFVSDSVTNLVRSSLYQVGLEATVVELKCKSLRDLLVKNRLFDVRCARRHCRVCPEIGEGGCEKKGVVYQIDCDCGEIYVGETGRPLADRFNEHARAAEKPDSKSYLATTWAKHSREKHGGRSLNISLKVLDMERNTVRRKILEGIHIKALNPTLNTKEELTDLVANMDILE
ncbi:hypothetical protein B9Z55_012791 [Caenorhabditis nigoni]|uniref:Reverse transcriptase domain-containing protein n=1 Tax=Caenorhabditis nigoni TaxID=1611254 RepID=A0A2G5TZU7_9PELO|nr:hypothetical protein B9Z55_012791 [Caenorhabditis nigoni]